jgi:ankyrin repeat protein
MSELITAVKAGDLMKVNHLITKGTDVNQRQYSYLKYAGDTALMCAVQGGNTNIVETLLKAGADVHLKNWDYTYDEEIVWTALSLAKQSGNKEIIKLLRMHEKYQKISLNLSKSAVKSLEDGKPQ